MCTGENYITQQLPHMYADKPMENKDGANVGRTCVVNNLISNDITNAVFHQELTLYRR